MVSVADGVEFVSSEATALGTTSEEPIATAKGVRVNNLFIP
ncbi:hypothetical protein D021_3034 [Vibrio parahaemolyticus 10296]|nr:hypothetical protein D021_3034 [Vibrio parahaemolyticus 10296]ETX25313.1 hypothetical protein D037_0993 [Vibrio parahaemolyticus IDH02640]